MASSNKITLERIDHAFFRRRKTGFTAEATEFAELFSNSPSPRPPRLGGEPFEGDLHDHYVSGSRYDDRSAQHDRSRGSAPR